MAASALTTATAAALTSTLPESVSKSNQQMNQQSPRKTANNQNVAVQAGIVEVSKILQEGEKFIKWDEVSVFVTVTHDFETRAKRGIFSS